ncbi:MAG: hypothetical protein JXR83_04530 [Deltaproteobacteria bacterium]|nr:hypothetical protein [Deltaproteobacteria bacterium]
MSNLWRAPERYSRNRNFELYDGVAGRRALRWYRQLRSIKRDIGAGSRLRVKRCARTAAVTVELDAIGGRRRSRLPLELFDLLLDDEEVGPLLRAALAETARRGPGRNETTGSDVTSGSDPSAPTARPPTS